jgi:two-component system sensor histidine kinase PilS (NtrC family)
MWLLPRFRSAAAPQALARPTSAQWLATIGADLALFTTLHVVSPGSSFNYVALLVFPVLMAGVLTPRVLALATARWRRWRCSRRRGSASSTAATRRS